MESLNSLGALFDSAYRRGAITYKAPDKLAQFLRKERGTLPMQMVSEAAGISVRGLQNVESGHGSHRSITKVADALGYEVVVLVIKKDVRQ